jgi:bifunctional DNase/RNase
MEQETWVQPKCYCGDDGIVRICQFGGRTFVDDKIWCEKHRDEQMESWVAQDYPLLKRGRQEPGLCEYDIRFIIFPLVNRSTFAHSLIISEIAGTKKLALSTGYCEASAIMYALQEPYLNRPITHPVMVNIIKSLGAKIDDVVIDDVREGIYTAKIRITHEREQKRIDLRPSDAIAFAMVANTSLYVAEAISSLL